MDHLAFVIPSRLPGVPPLLHLNHLSSSRSLESAATRSNPGPWRPSPNTRHIPRLTFHPPVITASVGRGAVSGIIHWKTSAKYICTEKKVAKRLLKFKFIQGSRRAFTISWPGSGHKVSYVHASATWTRLGKLFPARPSAVGLGQLLRTKFWRSNSRALRPDMFTLRDHYDPWSHWQPFTTEGLALKSHPSCIYQSTSATVALIKRSTLASGLYLVRRTN